MWKRVFKKTAVLFFIMMVLCGLIYTLVVTGITRLLFGLQADGSIIEIDGVKYGSTLLGQQYSDERHLWGRIVMTDTSLVNENGEPVLYAWASNKSPAGEEFETAVAERVAMIQAPNPDAPEEGIPVELVTSSGSGLDPHISPAAAEYQVPRLAEARGMTEEEVRDVIERYTEGKFLGILGEETVNVLEVNLALDGILAE